MTAKRSALVLATTLLVALPAVGSAARHRNSAQRGAQQASSAAPPGSGSNPAGGVSALQVANNIQAFYDRTNDFDAHFVQVSRNRLSGQVQRSEGRVRFLKPGRMRWDFATPAGDVIVSDGNTLWAFQAAIHQATMTPFNQSQLPSAFSFLTGNGRLTNDFTFRLLDAASMQYPTGYVLELRPINPNPSFERILFYVEPAHFQVARVVVFDAQGNTMRHDLSEPRVNTSIPLTEFQWHPPHGTQVVHP